MNCIAIHSIPGGVGKTTTAVNLAHLAARKGMRILLMDLDPQGAATWCLKQTNASSLEARKLIKKKLAKRVERVLRQTSFEGLDVLPASEDFQNLPQEIKDSGVKPRKAIERMLTSFDQQYDLVILDCPSGMDLAVETFFKAATVILVPLVPNVLNEKGYLTQKSYLRRRRIPPTRVRAFFSMVEPHRRRQKEHMDILWDEDEGGICEATIPRRVQAEEMAERQAPVTHFAPRSDLASAYEKLWSEIEPAFSPLS